MRHDYTNKGWQEEARPQRWGKRGKRLIAIVIFILIIAVICFINLNKSEKRSATIPPVKLNKQTQAHYHTIPLILPETGQS